MPRPELNKVIQIVLALLSLGIAAALAVVWFQNSRTQYLTIGAGAPGGESYILASALRNVVERHYPRVRIKVVETGGTTENLRMLENGSAQLATAQADITPGPSARTVAILYDDTFQLLVPKDSSVQSFPELRGRRIALARTGGQFRSFLQIATHFGLREEDFRFAGSTDAAADEVFRNGGADALFRVRALGNPAIRAMVQSEQLRFVPIGQAAAMQIDAPEFKPAVIPEGSYQGSPPVPPQNLPTVAVHRTLLARDDASEAAVRAVTAVLMESRQEVMQEIPAAMIEVRLLLAQVRRPEPQTGLGPPIHPGALSFYNRDKPSFLHANADYIGLLITLVLMVGSWIWELKQWMQRKQKNAADEYSNRAMALMGSAQTANSVGALDGVWRALLAVLTEAVADLDADRLSEESFETFRSILQIAMDVTKERRAILASVGSATAITSRESAFHA